MKLEHEEDGFSIQLLYDMDGFPMVNIDTGGGYLDENDRPTVEISVNGEKNSSNVLG